MREREIRLDHQREGMISDREEQEGARETDTD